MANEYVKLSRQENLARGIGQYAIDFLAGRLGEPSPQVLAKVEQFHLDSVACGVAGRSKSPSTCRTRGERSIGEETSIRTGFDMAV